MKKIGIVFLCVFQLLFAGGCLRSPEIQIDRNSVRIEKGKYNGESIELSFYAELTDTIKPEGIYWSRFDGKFHPEEYPKDGISLCYEVFNPFGELELKTFQDAAGPSKEVPLLMPVFWSEDNPFEYTLKVTLYINARKMDSYSANFFLTHP